MAKQKTKLEEIEDRLNLVLSSVGEIQEKFEAKTVNELRKESPLKKHFNALVENALESPHSTLSGLAVGACAISTHFFPEHSAMLADLQTAFTGLTGITAGNAIINKSKQNTAPVPSIKSDEEYG